MKKLVGAAAFLATPVVLVVAATALATPPSTAPNLVSETLASGNYGALVLKTKIHAVDWESELETKGESNLVVAKNTLQPGATFGWHSHPVPSLVIVTKGESTFYRGDDPDCEGEKHVAGTPSAAYVDPGGTVHLARNEGTEVLELYVVRLFPKTLPPGVTARIDQTQPVQCDGVS
jgi:quercetin dioxygenase-like cupin family protein